MAAAIRPVERADLAAVHRLVTAHMLGGFARSRAFMEAMLVDDPWAPEELPALVATEEGEIVGFIGAQARRMRFDDTDIHGINVSQFAVAADRRGTGTAMLLLRRLLSGPQDLTWAEGAPEAVARMWRLLGGDEDHARSCDWMIVLRPMRWLGGIIAKAPRSGLHRHRVPVVALPAQAVWPRMLKRASHPSLEGVSAHDATAAEVVEELPALTKRTRLRVEYDEQHLEHMFEHWGSVAGSVVCRLVRRQGRAVGWYAYLPRQGRASRLLHVATLDREAESVVAELLADARDRGSAVLAGRLEPHIAEALRGWSPAIGFGDRPVFHTRNDELRGALAQSNSLLTELDSIDSGWL